MDCYQLFAENIQRFKVGSNGQAQGLCPFHDDHNPSFSVCLDKDSEDYGLWHCGGCGAEGNAYQFAKRIGIDPTPYMSYKTSKKPYKQSDIETRARQFKEYLITKFDDLKASGKIPTFWTLKAVEDTLTGYDKTKDCLVFTHCNLSGQPINIQHHKGKQDGQSKSKLFPLNLIPKYDKASFIVFCEGCKDAVTLLSHGINTITNTTGAASIPKDLTPLKDFQRIYIVYDNDPAGIKGSQTFANKLSYEFKAMDIRIYFWINQPSGYDITDYFLEGNNTTDFYKLLLNSETFRISNGNWLKLYRKSRESEAFKKPLLWHLFSYCLIKANHKRQYVTWKTGKGSITILVKRGQFVFGRNQLAKELNVKPSTLLYRLKRLQEMGNIEIKADKQYSILTICNYEAYQQ